MIKPIKVTCSQCQTQITPVKVDGKIIVSDGYLTFVGVDVESDSLLIAGVCPKCRIVVQGYFSAVQLMAMFSQRMQDEILQGFLLNMEDLDGPVRGN